MKGKISIQLKAGLILIVFAMNTVIGLACAAGIDMSFNSKHHIEEQVIKTPVHAHADGKKHDHHNEANKHNHEEKKASEKDACCNDVVVKFQNVEKKINPTTTIEPPVFVAIVNTFPATNLFNISRTFPDKKIVRFFYPPPPNILIAIQRFQI